MWKYNRNIYCLSLILLLSGAVVAEDIAPVAGTRLVPVITKTDEGCDMISIAKNGFVIECQTPIEKNVKEAPLDATVLFSKDARIITVIYDEASREKDAVIEIGLASTIIAVVDQAANGYWYCFNAPTCSSTYFYAGPADNVGYVNAINRWALGANIFNVSELSGETIATATVNLSTYPTNNNNPEDQSPFYIGFCDCDACDGETCLEPVNWDTCGFFSTFTGLASADATGWDWSGWGWHATVDISSALQDAVDAMGGDCVAMIFKYNETLMPAKDYYSRQVTGNSATLNHRPYISYTLGEGGNDCGLVLDGDWLYNAGDVCIVDDVYAKTAGDMRIENNSQVIFEADFLMSGDGAVNVNDTSLYRFRDGVTIRWR